MKIKTDILVIGAGGAHFFMGGVRIKERCETNIEGLYAAGEVSGGVHGANRMGENALVEIIVLGARASRYAAEYAKRADWIEPEEAPIKEEHDRLYGFFKIEGVAPKTVMDKIATFMAEYVGVGRRGTDLMKALSEIESLRADVLPKLRAPQSRWFNLGWIEGVQVPYMVSSERWKGQ
jgi:succinate dehydrogenase/fumarate reductase flavoprotein subunit